MWHLTRHSLDTVSVLFSADFAHLLGLTTIRKTPCGSSSGSAIGVAAGFAPVSVGSECDGSIVQPACRAALYGMKATPGTIPGAGAFPTSREFDSHGGMAKTTDDLAKIMGLLMNKNFDSSLKASWDGLNVGFVDPEHWQPASFVVEENKDFQDQTVRQWLVPSRLALTFCSVKHLKKP